MAERIWGEARVAEEWCSESWMPAQVRRWIPKARALAAGGWRNLVPAMCRSHGGPRRPWGRTRKGRPPGRKPANDNPENRLGSNLTARW